MIASEETHLGKLVRTLKERCEICNTAIQVRAKFQNQLAKGESVSFETQYKYCPKCKTEEVFDREGGWKNGYQEHHQSKRAFERDAKSRRKGFARGNGRNFRSVPS